MEKPSASSERIRGLDSIRFICALWVLFGHYAAPPLVNGIDRDSRVGYLIGGLWERTFTGTPAVIIFFIISGFCIHYPFAKTNIPLKLGEFYARRFLRILIPLLVAIPISWSVDVRLSLFEESVLWSLVAELIYYCIYPAIRIAARVWGWRVLLIISFVGAIAVAFTNPTALRYPSFGSNLNWALGLPCWMMGCVLAEFVISGKALVVSRLQIWSWRLVLYLAGMICIVLRFRDEGAIGFPWTLNVFAIIAAFWLHREIAFYRAHPPSRLLEWAGVWSYSLYLMHMPAKPFFDALQPPNLGYFFNWLILCLFVLVFCYVFYLVVERPGHEIARRASRFFGNLKQAKSAREGEARAINQNQSSNIDKPADA